MKATIQKFVGLSLLVTALAASAESEVESGSVPLIAHVSASELAVRVSSLADGGSNLGAVSEASARESRARSNLIPVTLAEPGSWALLALGAAGLFVARRASSGK